MPHVSSGLPGSPVVGAKGAKRPFGNEMETRRGDGFFA
jgi:hypothetical protein